MVIRHRMFKVSLRTFKREAKFYGRCFRSNNGKLSFPVLVDHADDDDWTQTRWVAVIED